VHVVDAMVVLFVLVVVMLAHVLLLQYKSVQLLGLLVVGKLKSLLDQIVLLIEQFKRAVKHLERIIGAMELHITSLIIRIVETGVT